LTVLAVLYLGIWAALVGLGVLPPEDLPPDVLEGGMGLGLLPLAGSLGGLPERGSAGADSQRRAARARSIA